MLTADRPQRILYADQEHSGLRAVVFISLFAALWLAFQLLTGLLPELLPRNLTDYAVFLSCVGAVPLALAAVWGVETLLKRVWHSGLTLALDGTGICVEDKRADRKASKAGAFEEPGQPAFLWAEPLRFTNWYFRLGGYSRGGRERRVSPKWYCLASELQQDESQLIVFTFMPPQRAEELVAKKQGPFAFHQILPAELQTKTMRSRLGPPSRPSISNQLLHSKDGRYWLAERRRWEQGVELTQEDFETLLAFAQTHQTSAPLSDESGQTTDDHGRPTMDK
jgi:hypothetical protein